MNHERLGIPDIVLFTPRRDGDTRGFFSETFRQDTFDAAAGPSIFVQDNHARSGEAGVIRGLHFQRPPRAQGKLVRVVRGAIFDVAVDIRLGSPIFGQHVAFRRRIGGNSGTRSISLTDIARWSRTPR
jgi:dTDP-4-dehydrorhamnose 3,5-epimerase